MLDPPPAMLGHPLHPSRAADLSIKPAPPSSINKQDGAFYCKTALGRSGWAVFGQCRHLGLPWMPSPCGGGWGDVPQWVPAPPPTRVPPSSVRGTRGERRVWIHPFSQIPSVRRENRLTKGADLGALPVAPWATGVLGGSLLAAPGRGCAPALGGMLVSGGQLWFNLGKVVMVSPSFSEMISREGGGTPAPVAPWLPSGAALGSQGGIFERCGRFSPRGFCCAAGAKETEGAARGDASCPLPGLLLFSKKPHGFLSAAARAGAGRDVVAAAVWVAGAGGGFFWSKMKISGCCLPSWAWDGRGLGADGHPVPLTCPCRGSPWDGDAGVAEAVWPSGVLGWSWLWKIICCY